MASNPSTVQLSDGTNIKVWLLGGNDKSKPLVIALHGAPGLSCHVEPATSFSFLTSHCRLLVYDARGSGESDGKAPLNDERWIADVDEIRQWAGADKFILAGGSYGGFIALGYVLAHPAHVSALILRDTWAYGFRGSIRNAATVAADPRIKNSDAAQQLRLWTGEVRDNDDFRAGLATIMPMYNADAGGDGPAAKPARKFEGAAVCFRYETHNAAFSYSVPRFDVRARLGEVQSPTLVVVGRQDLVATVDDSEELHRGIRASELTVFEKSGHSPPTEEPEAFQERVWKFLRDARVVK